MKTSLVVCRRFLLPHNATALRMSILSDSMIKYLDSVLLRHRLLGTKLESPDQLSPQDLRQTGKKYAELGQVVALAKQRVDIKATIEECLSIEHDTSNADGQDGKELLELAKSEREDAEKELESTDRKLLKLIIPTDQDDSSSSAVIEVRAGTGGDEASLFAGEIFKMYENFALFKGWKWELLSVSKGDIGGFKEAQATMRGEGVFKTMKFEAGVHRVQRIPVNDVKIQTSAASVIVMPEPEDLDVDIRMQDIRVDVFRAGGAGGQSVNKTESAVRMTHIPTGIVVSMQV